MLLALIHQHDIGWNIYFFKWWLSFEWAASQYEYYKFLLSWRTRKRWVITIIKRLWQIAWDLWDHQNKVLHNQENVLHRDQEDHLNRRIHRLYFEAFSKLKVTKDKYLLHHPPSSLGKKPVLYRNEWEQKTKTALILARKKWITAIVFVPCERF